ncbi:uncharacterized protein J3R85_019381, partial [Psidium guajava]
GAREDPRLRRRLRRQEPHGVAALSLVSGGNPGRRLQGLGRSVPDVALPGTRLHAQDPLVQVPGAGRRGSDQRLVHGDFLPAPRRGGRPVGARDPHRGHRCRLRRALVLQEDPPLRAGPPRGLRLLQRAERDLLWPRARAAHVAPRSARPHQQMRGVHGDDDASEDVLAGALENGTWDTGGACVRTRPYGEGEIDLGSSEWAFRNIQMEEMARAEGVRRERGRRFAALDVTRAMLMRPDGHPGEHWGNKWMRGYNDCVHWCLPGPIDVWSDFLMAALS